MTRYYNGEDVPIPSWLVPGAMVRYHPVIGGPPTGCYIVRVGPTLLASGQWVVWLEGKVGCVSIESVTLFAAGKGRIQKPYPPGTRYGLVKRSNIYGGE